MKTGKWTNDEYDYVRAHFMEQTEREIGEALDRKPASVGCMAHWLGLHKGWGKARSRTYAINDQIFKTWTPISAYLIGLILTDGNIQERIFSFASKDIELVEKFKNALSSFHPIKKDPKKDIYFLLIGHKKMVADLKAIGLTENKSKTVTLPEIPDNFFFDFLRGYVDGDGGIYNRFKWGLTLKLTTGSPFILDDISNTISRLLEIQKRDQAPKKGMKGNTECSWYELAYYGMGASMICEAMYEHCGTLFLSRKRQAFSDYLNRPKDWRSNGNGTKYKVKEA